jgi:hypothetical protein
VRLVSSKPVIRPRQAERVVRHRARHDSATRARHRVSRISVLRYVAQGDVATLLTAPVVYALLAPFVLLDLCVSLYQAVCFRAWNVRRVRRDRFIAVDRHRLAYLNAIEKVNCLYCSYVNGLIAYVREVAARTEQYWCPIRHARRVHGVHGRYDAFVAYGDARGYGARRDALRAAIRR